MSAAIPTYSYCEILNTNKESFGCCLLNYYLLFCSHHVPSFMKQASICRKFLKRYEWITIFFIGIFPVFCLVLIKMGGAHIALACTALNHFNKLTAKFSQMLQNLVLKICQHSKAFCSTQCVTK